MLPVTTVLGLYNQLSFQELIEMSSIMMRSESAVVKCDSLSMAYKYGAWSHDHTKSCDEWKFWKETSEYFVHFLHIFFYNFSDK